MKQNLRLRAAQAENLPEALDADAVRELAEDALAMLDLMMKKLIDMKCTEENVEEIRKGIAGYAHEQKVLLRWIRMRGLLSSELFDSVLSSRGGLGRSFKGKPRLTKLSGFGISGDSFLLGGLSGHKGRDWYLDLLQHMMYLGMVDTVMVDGVIHYRLPKRHSVRQA